MVVIAALVFVGKASAQTGEEVPDIITQIFSPALVAAAMVIVTATKLIRNMLGGIKGAWAVVITFVVAIAYSFIQNFSTSGVWYSLLVGAIAGFISAGTFWISKKVGQSPPAQAIASRLGG